MEENSYSQFRAEMVDRQIATRGVVDPRVLEALRRVPRHEFLSRHYWTSAYDDRALPIGYEQTISQPLVVGWMTQALHLKASDRVLEIGTGSGYQAAILAELAYEVVSVERIELLAMAARNALGRLGYANVTIVVGDGSLGYSEAAPFQAILVAAASPSVPPPLLRQLDDGGRLIAPCGARDSQRLTLVTRRGGVYTYTKSDAVSFVPLVGEFGW